MQPPKSNFNSRVTDFALLYGKALRLSAGKESLAKNTLDYGESIHANIPFRKESGEVT
jgi:hypothetical protein